MKGIYRETCCCCCCCFVVGCESEGIEENQKEGEESRRDWKGLQADQWIA